MSLLHSTQQCLRVPRPNNCYCCGRQHIMHRLKPAPVTGQVVTSTAHIHNKWLASHSNGLPSRQDTQWPWSRRQHHAHNRGTCHTGCTLINHSHSFKLLGSTSAVHIADATQHAASKGCSTACTHGKHHGSMQPSVRAVCPAAGSVALTPLGQHACLAALK
jgi:hypothetical protein